MTEEEFIPLDQARVAEIRRLGEEKTKLEKELARAITQAELAKKAQAVAEARTRELLDVEVERLLDRPGQLVSVSVTVDLVCLRAAGEQRLSERLTREILAGLYKASRKGFLGEGWG